ncbi:outer membrane beta-barrel protein [Pedobacter sp. KBS0701]|uniref:outer membrane beta-barrel family protein n=1 Tax=Pedobacter sp. KBS0701 TaxID=2578106 RepID=UPI00110E6A2D|nr:outer membrane beta-barrel family protein [Pedobacter sp. KBS0701]QDW25498.1 outer membrane beta-barrel protein [Pedobacter sp. KBS0701]
MTKHCPVFLFLLFTVFVNSGKAMAQDVQLSGTVVGSGQKPLDFVTVSVLKIDSLHQLRQTFSNEKGFFSLTIPRGDYVLLLKQVGREIFKKRMVLSDNTDLGQINVESPIQLNAITVTGQKILIERKVDRLVFNLSNSPASSGISGFEALAMTPLIDTRDENSLKIVGKSQVAMMIDGRLLPLQGEDIVNYLKSLRSDNIEKIEIITAPPSKYDAVGNSGIINIILKKNKNKGLSGTVSNTYSQRKYGSDNINTTLNYQTNKLGITGNLGVNYDKAIPYENFDIKNADNEYLLLQKNDRTDIKHDYVISLNTTYTASSKSKLWVSYDFRPRKSDIEISSSAYYPATSVKNDSSILTNVQRERKIQSHIANINYEVKIGKDSSERKLSLSTNYLNNFKKEPNYFEILNNPQFNFTKTDNDVRYQIWSGQSDLNLPNRVVNVETGVKFTKIENSLYQDLSTSLNTATQSNNFAYDEKIYSAYLTLAKKVSQQLEISSGLRYENSQVDLVLGEKIKKSLGSFFPSFYITYTTKEHGVYSLNYTKRINRPDFQSLNPYKLFTNSNVYSVGNPLLNPSINHNFELSYSKDNFSINAFWQYEKNGYSSIFGLDAAGDNYTAIDNFFNKSSAGLYITYYKSLTPWWQVQATGDFEYQHSHSFIQQYLGQSGTSFYYNIQNNVFLNQKKTFKMNIGFWQNLPRNDINIHWKGASNLSAALNYTTLQKALVINIGVYDILRTNLSRGQMYNDNYIRSFNNYYDARKVVIGMTYNFGNRNIKENRKKGNFEENQRAT